MIIKIRSVIDPEIYYNFWLSIRDELGWFQDKGICVVYPRDMYPCTCSTKVESHDEDELGLAIQRMYFWLYRFQKILLNKGTDPGDL